MSYCSTSCVDSPGVVNLLHKATEHPYPFIQNSINLCLDLYVHVQVSVKRGCTIIQITTSRKGYGCQLTLEISLPDAFYNKVFYIF